MSEDELHLVVSGRDELTDSLVALDASLSSLERSLNDSMSGLREQFDVLARGMLAVGEALMDQGRRVREIQENLDLIQKLDEKTSPQGPVLT